MSKQTASNNVFLYNVKKQYNAKIFKKVSQIVNSEGISQAITYIGQFTAEEYRQERITQLLSK